MKKILGLVTVLMIVLSSMAYAGGDKVRGDKGVGDTNQVGANSQGNQAG
jgi:hypothetical protein